MFFLGISSVILGESVVVKLRNFYSSRVLSSIILGELFVTKVKRNFYCSWVYIP